MPLRLAHSCLRYAQACVCLALLLLGRQDVLRVLSSRGVAAHVVVGASSASSASVAANTSAAAPPSATSALAAAPSTPPNALFQAQSPSPPLLQALRPAALQTLLLRLGSRGRPGVEVEAALAEEVFVDMACPDAALVLIAVRH